MNSLVAGKIFRICICILATAVADSDAAKWRGTLSSGGTGSASVFGLNRNTISKQALAEPVASLISGVSWLLPKNQGTATDQQTADRPACDYSIH